MTLFMTAFKSVFSFYFSMLQCTLKCIHAILFQNDEDVNSEISEDVLSDSENNEANSSAEEEDATDTEEVQVSKAARINRLDFINNHIKIYQTQEQD